MPDPFQPKFVDLVRNFTTTQGTGNFVLGAAVAGHSSLAGAVATGERFYYCAMGVDKPAEREVGRGTMLAGGQIAREPISGPLTNFSQGTKTISLVVAADWFAAVDAAVAAGSGGVTGALSLTFATVSGAAIGATVTAIETAGHSTPGIGGARYVYDASVDAAFVAAHPAWSFLAASGRGFRLNEDVLQLEYFGAIPGDFASGVSADCYAAWTAAMDYLDFHPRNISSPYYEGALEIHFPGAQYFFSETLELKRTLRLTGPGSGYPIGNPTILRWPAGKTGIIVHSYNTIGLITEGTPTTSGAGSSIRGLKLLGAYGGTEGEYHGVHLRGRTSIRDVTIQYFQGDGLHIVATAGAGGIAEGNVNNFDIHLVEIQGCRNGIYCAGADVNAGVGFAIDTSANRQWGIWDSSFLGNTWIACHADGNGLVTGSPPSVVSHGGSRYCVKAGQEAGASTNAPSGTGADNAYWYYTGAGGVNAPNNIPAWTSGTSYRASGAYRCDGINAETLFLGCYSEGGQGFSQGTSPTLSIGGGQGAPWRGSAVHISNYLNKFSSSSPIGTRSADGQVTSHFLSANDQHLSLVHPSGPLGYTLQWFNNNLMLNYAGLGAAEWVPYEVTGPSTARNVGTHKVNFPAWFGIADKKMLNGAAVPASGTYVQGDICWNSAPAAGGAPGWVCTAGGTPGTWKAMASLAA